MKRRIVWGLLGIMLATLVSLSGCMVEARPVPYGVVEGRVWVPGYWAWNGGHQVWVRGHWS